MSKDLPYPKLDRQFLGIHSINPVSNHNSSPRGAMMASHINQTLVIKGAEPPLLESGVNQELGNYTYNIVAPEDLIVRAIIPVTGVDIARELDIENPRRLLIYEGIETSTIGIIWLENFHTLSGGFGFAYNYNPKLFGAGTGDFISKGTVLADTPSKDNKDLYGIGINLKTAFLTHPGTADDGIVIAEDVLPKLGFYMEERTSYGLTVVSKKSEVGRMTLPLNLYGDELNPKTFPDIGQMINEEGIIFGLRELYPETMLQMTPKRMMEVDHVFDEYYQGRPGSIVTDIDVIRGSILDTSNNPLFDQLNLYADARIEFNREVLRTVSNIKYTSLNNGIKLDYTPELSGLIKRTLLTTPAEMGGAVTASRAALRIRPVAKQVDIGDYHITFNVRYHKIPNYGFKLTDLNGGKGVICSILPREQMPGGVDAIVDPNSTVGRTNLGRTIEVALTSSMERMNNGVRAIVGYTDDTDINTFKVSTQVLNKAIDYIVKFYDIITPSQADFIRNLNNKDKRDVIIDIVTKGAILHLPINRDKNDVDVLLELAKYGEYSPYKEYLSWKDSKGKEKTTKNKVMVGSLYFLLLNKICSTGIAAASVPLNHFGIPSKMPTKIKGWSIIKESPVKAIGETEGRLILGYLKPEAIAEFMDRAGNPVTHVSMYENILKSKNPADIDNLVNRGEIPFGNNRPLKLFSHQMLIRGKEVAYDPEDGK